MYIVVGASMSNRNILVCTVIVTVILKLTLLSRYRRTTHVTPKSYLSFLAGYKTIYSNKRTEIGDMAKRMNTGMYVTV